MSVVLAIGVVVGFAAVLDGLDLPAYAREVVDRNRDCLKIMRDSSMDDRAKEDALQRHARRLFLLLGVLGGGSGFAIALPLLIVWLLEQTGVSSLSAVLSVLQRLDFLAGTVVAGGLGYLLVRSVRQP